MKAFDINLEEIENNIKNHIITRLEEYEDRGLFIYKNACNEWLLEYSETTDLPAFIDILVDDLNCTSILSPYTEAYYLHRALEVFEEDDRTYMNEEELQNIQDVLSELLKKHYIDRLTYNEYLYILKNDDLPSEAYILGKFPYVTARIVYENIAKDVITQYAQTSDALQSMFNFEIESAEEDYDEGFDELEESVKRHKRRLYY